MPYGFADLIVTLKRKDSATYNIVHWDGEAAVRGLDLAANSN